MAAIGAPRISRYLGRKRFQRFSPRASRNIATETATRLRSSPSAALTRARAESTVVIPMLLHDHPLRPEQGEGDEADDGGGRDQQRADGDALPHLLARHPLPVGDEPPLHLPHECDGPAEAEEAQAQEVEDKLANRDAR